VRFRLHPLACTISFSPPLQPSNDSSLKCLQGPNKVSIVSFLTFFFDVFRGFLSGHGWSRLPPHMFPMGTLPETLVAIYSTPLESSLVEDSPPLKMGGRTLKMSFRPLLRVSSPPFKSTGRECPSPSLFWRLTPAATTCAIWTEPFQA